MSVSLPISSLYVIVPPLVSGGADSGHGERGREEYGFAFPVAPSRASYGSVLCTFASEKLSHP